MQNNSISELALALSLFAAFIGTFSFVLSVYNLVYAKSRRPRAVMDDGRMPPPSFDLARDFTAGEPRGRSAPHDNLGMPEVHDPEGDEDERGHGADFYDAMGV